MFKIFRVGNKIEGSRSREPCSKQLGEVKNCLGKNRGRNAPRRGLIFQPGGEK